MLHHSLGLKNNEWTMITSVQSLHYVMALSRVNTDLYSFCSQKEYVVIAKFKNNHRHFFTLEFQRSSLILSPNEKLQNN